MRLLRCLMAMSWTFLTTPATTTPTTTAEVAVPHNGRAATGFQYRHPPFVRGFRRARACGPIVTSKSVRQKGNRNVLRETSSLRRDSEEGETAAEMVEGSAGGDRAPLPDENFRNVIVTGANRGLGFAIADRMLALDGYRVVLACRSRPEVCVCVCVSIPSLTTRRADLP